MEKLTQVNLLDVGICAMIAGGALMGWHRGLIRQLLGMAAFYVALVLGAQYHHLLGGWAMSIAPDSQWVIVDAITFLLVFLVVMLIFGWVGSQIYSDTHIPFFVLLDGLSGAVFGLFTAWFEIVLGLSVIRFSLSVNWMQLEGARQVILPIFSTSVLQPIFSATAPLAYGLIRPWLPSGLPALLSF